MFKLQGFKSKVCFVVSLFVMVCFSPSDVFSQTQLNGIAVHTYLGKDQFMAAIHAEILTQNNKSFLQTDQEKRMEVKILAPSISSRVFRQLWIEGVAINASTAELESHAQNVADFSNLLKPSLKQGDTLVIHRREEVGVEIRINNVVFGLIEDVLFFDLLARVWVGSVPLSSKFREDLMQGGDIDSKTKSDFLLIEPTEERIKKMEEHIFQIAEKAEKKRSEAALAAANAIKAKKSKAAKKNVVKPPVKINVVKPVITKPSVVPVHKKILPEVSEEDSPDFVYTAKLLLAKQLYIAALYKWTTPFIKYPKSALRRGYEGALRLTVTVARNGEVTDIAIIESSGYKSLDKGAVSAVKRASPYPRIPGAIEQESFSFAVPIAFALRKKAP